MIRHPKIRVLKQIIATHRGLVDPAEAGAVADDGAEAGALRHSDSSESMAIQDVANQDIGWVSMCFLNTCNVPLEQCSKFLLVDDYGGLYYPIYGGYNKPIEVSL